MFRTLDIFCGAGGSSAGAKAAGAEIVAGIDACRLATGTYKANFPKAKVVTGLLEDVALPDLKRQIGSVDLLLASPECRNHTCARGAAPLDEPSRETALLTIEYARAFQPRWLVLENVIHMRPWFRYNELKNSLRKLGYKLAEHVLNASDFGVPQSRRRLFLMGDRERKPEFDVPPEDKDPAAARSILDDPGTWRMSPLFSARRAKATITKAKRAFAAQKEGTSFLLVYYGNDGSGGWQPLDRPLRTITTVDRFALVEHDGDMWRMRMLQVPELRRAMGHGSDFKLPVGTRRDRIKLLGNGVCPPVMEAVVQSLILVD
jgi:DNA (cytosine-5)-methyltransferase 1